MRRPRFSIASVLLVISFLAVAIAALREATDLWDSGIFSLTASVLLASVLLAVHRTGRGRAFWLGFALFGWSYLIASLVPPVEARLLTTKALASLDSKVPRATATGVAWADFDSDGLVDILVANASASDAVFRNRGNGTFQDVTSGSPAAPGNKPSSAETIVWNTSTVLKLFLGTRWTSGNFVRIGHSLLTLLVAMSGGALSRSIYVRGHGPHVEVESVCFDRSAG
jgi:hypothetical protein